MRSRYSTIALLLAFASTGLLWGEMRSWTLLPEGKSVEAEYVDVEENRVTLLVDGKEQSIALSKLSAEDQAYVQALAERVAEHQQNKNFSDPWPKSTVMADKLRARVVVEDEPTGTYIYETSHFRFFSPARLSLPTVSEMGRVFEGTYSACQAIPLNFPCRRFGITRSLPADGEAEEEQEKLVVRLFRTQADFAREVGTAYARSAGIFREPEILVPFESLGIRKKGKNYAVESAGKLDTGTIIHELTHQMSLIDASYDVPIWFAEGIAEYVRLANYKRGRFDFSSVHKNVITCFVGGPGTISRQLGRHVGSPPLEQMLNLSVRDFQSARGGTIQINYGFSTLLTYYFIHLAGEGGGAKLKRRMRHLQGTRRATAGLSMQIPADASPAEIAAAQNYLQQQALNIKEEYYYVPLLNGRSWQQLENEFSLKIERELGIRVTFPSGK